MKLIAKANEIDKFSCRCNPKAISLSNSLSNTEKISCKSEGNIDPKVSTIYIPFGLNWFKVKSNSFNS